MSFTENFYRSRDGLQLYYRDYAGDREQGAGAVPARAHA